MTSSGSIPPARSVPTSTLTPPQPPAAVHLLLEASHLLRFSDRVEYLRQFVASDRKKHDVEGIKFALQIRRSQFLQDAFARIMSLEDLGLLRAKFHVEFIDVHGIPEAGIDAGVCSRSFSTKL